jgi:hypothetical protein
LVIEELVIGQPAAFHLPNYEITHLPNQKWFEPGTLTGILGNRREQHHEGSGISQEDLRQVQDRAPQGCGASDLRERETQAETRIITNW